MPAPVTYRQAIKTLGGLDPEWLEAIEALLGGGILSAAVLTGPGPLALLGPKDESFRLIRRAIRATNEGQARRQRGAALEAGYGLIAVAAGFEVFDEYLSASGAKPPEWLASDSEDRRMKHAPQREQFFQGPVLRPRPDLTASEWTSNSLAFYRGLSSRLLRLLKDFASWENLNETRREYLQERLQLAYPQDCVTRLESSLLEASSDVPEFGTWITANSFKALADQADVHYAQQHVALESLSAGLQSISQIVSQRGQTEISSRLATHYVAELRRPLLGDEVLWPFDTPAPSISRQDLYIKPFFRSLDPSTTPTISEDSVWSGADLRDDFESYIVAALTNPTMFRAPLLVCGHPGSGKSLLTRVLAARVADQNFTSIRVPLRNVTANATIQAQIEEATSFALNDRIDWRSWRSEVGTAVPLVMLDGLDELLQATGNSASDYLLKVAEFQQRELDQGLPVLFLVTTRTVVADKALIPESTLAVRLEPFDNTQVNQWVSAWNIHLAHTYEQMQHDPLDLASVMNHPQLAEQPILLLMLALYDLDGPGLRGGESLAQTELYQRLIASFVRREVKKTVAEHEPSFGSAASAEERRLEVIALGMFNRGQQFITGRQADTDLAALLPASTSNESDDASAGEAQLLRFFFVINASAQQGGRGTTAVARSFEFLHATFGEYLTCRMMVSTLRRALALEKLTASAGGASEEAMASQQLRRLFEHRPLVASPNIITMAKEVVEREGTLDCHHFLLDCLRRTSKEVAIPLTSYDPGQRTAVQRNAIFALNLCVFYIHFVGPLSLRNISDCVGADGWRRLTGLWRSCLEPSQWESLLVETKLAIAPSDNSHTSEFSDAPSPDLILVPNETQQYAEPDLRNLDVGRALSDINPLLVDLSPKFDESLWPFPANVSLVVEGSYVSRVWTRFVYESGNQRVPHLHTLFAARQSDAGAYDVSLARSDHEQPGHAYDEVRIAELIGALTTPLDGADELTGWPPQETATTRSRRARLYQMTCAALAAVPDHIRSDAHGWELRRTLELLCRDAKHLNSGSILDILDPLFDAVRRRQRAIRIAELELAADILGQVWNRTDDHSRTALQLYSSFVDGSRMFNEQTDPASHFAIYAATARNFGTAFVWEHFPGSPEDFWMEFFEGETSGDRSAAMIGEAFSTATRLRMREWCNSHGGHLLETLPWDTLKQVDVKDLAYCLAVNLSLGIRTPAISVSDRSSVRTQARVADLLGDDWQDMDEGQAFQFVAWFELFH